MKTKTKKRGASDGELLGGCLFGVIAILLAGAIVSALVLMVAYAFRIGAGL